MKRSEMILHIRRYSYHKFMNMSLDDFSEGLLSFMEEAGMLPPMVIKEDPIIGGIDTKRWEWEDEEK